MVFATAFLNKWFGSHFIATHSILRAWLWPHTGTSDHHLITILWITTIYSKILMLFVWIWLYLYLMYFFTRTRNCVLKMIILFYNLAIYYNKVLLIFFDIVIYYNLIILLLNLTEWNLCSNFQYTRGFGLEKFICASCTSCEVIVQVIVRVWVRVLIVIVLTALTITILIIYELYNHLYKQENRLKEKKFLKWKYIMKKTLWNIAI